MRTLSGQSDYVGDRINRGNMLGRLGLVLAGHGGKSDSSAAGGRWSARNGGKPVCRTLQVALL